MKVRSIKRRFFHMFAGRVEAAKTVAAKVITVVKYPVIRKKDGVEVAIVESVAEAEALIAKAKAAKKASLELGTPFEQAA